MSTMMRLGSYRFSINTSAYQKLQRSIEYRWKNQDRIQNDPAMQYVGTGLEQIELEGIIYPEFKGGLNQIEYMKKSANIAQPLLLIDGLGGIWGRWIINRIEENQEIFLKSGVPRKVTFRIAITKYSEEIYEQTLSYKRG